MAEKTRIDLFPWEIDRLIESMMAGSQDFKDEHLMRKLWRAQERSKVNNSKGKGPRK